MLMSKTAFIRYKQIHDSNGSFELQSLDGRWRRFPFSQIKRSTTLILSTATASVLLGS